MQSSMGHTMAISDLFLSDPPEEFLRDHLRCRHSDMAMGNPLEMAMFLRKFNLSIVEIQRSELERSAMLLMGKLTISTDMFNSYVKLPEGINHEFYIAMVDY